MVIDGIYVNCAVCGAKIENILSNNSEVSPYIAIDMLNTDRLDFRPIGSVEFGNFFNGLQQCPHCGYVAPNLALMRFGADKVVLSAEYNNRYTKVDSDDYEQKKRLCFKKCIFISWNSL